MPSRRHQVLSGLILMPSLSKAGPGLVQQANAPEPGRHALLVGCTRYPSLPSSRWLEGPGNDVVLMRTLLIEHYHFSPEKIVTLAEGVGGEVNRPTRAQISANSIAWRRRSGVVIRSSSCSPATAASSPIRTPRIPMTRSRTAWTRSSCPPTSGNGSTRSKRWKTRSSTMSSASG